MKVKHRKNHDSFFRQTEVDSIRKSVQQCASDVDRHRRELQRGFTDPFEDVIDSVDEPQTQLGLLLFVPARSSVDLRLRRRPYDPPTHHRAV
jgi:hypothetical protein